MRIAIIGAGNVGATLGPLWSRKGHEVVYGVRNPAADKVQGLVHRGRGKACAASIAEAIALCDTVLLAVPWEAVEDVIRQGRVWEDKVIIDCTNPHTKDYTGLTVGHDTSAAEKIAGWAEGAKVVKAFNMTGAKNMADPVYPDGKLTMFICGDDPDANKAAGLLAEELGFEVVDAGPLRAARWLEPLAMLWIHLAHAMNMGPDFGFRLIRRQQG